MGTRRLVVMRHATARAHAETDRARALTRRGLDEAVEVARQLTSVGLCPDHAVVSDATRARQTWEALREACGSGEAVLDASLYTASADTVLEALRLSPARAATVLHVGHNPAAEYLAAVLSDGEGDPAAMRALLSGMAPATAAVFEVEVAWADLGPGVGRVQHVFRPRR